MVRLFPLGRPKEKDKINSTNYLYTFRNEINNESCNTTSYSDPKSYQSHFPDSMLLLTFIYTSITIRLLLLHILT